MLGWVLGPGNGKRPRHDFGPVSGRRGKIMDQQQAAEVLRNLDLRTRRMEQILPDLPTREEMRSVVEEAIEKAVAPLATNARLDAAVAGLATNERLDAAV